jgi:hypothetical protein
MGGARKPHVMISLGPAWFIARDSWGRACDNEELGLHRHKNKLMMTCQAC